jgi:hypothetical protein
MTEKNPERIFARIEKRTLVPVVLRILSTAHPLHLILAGTCAELGPLPETGRPGLDDPTMARRDRPESNRGGFDPI